MPLSVYIGVDLGTTNLKALAIDARSSAIVAHAARPVATLSPKPDVAEQDADQLWTLFLDMMAELARELPAEVAIGGVSFSTAMHSLLAVDEAGKPLTNALIWSDNRAATDAATIKQEHPDLYQIVGVPIHPMLPLCKLAWFKRTNPRLLKRASRWVSVKDYFWWKLTGRYEIDYAMAGATGMFNSTKTAWHLPALALAGIRPDQLSTPVDTTQTVPYVPPATGAVPGLRAGVPLVIGASDGCLANIGAGALEPGITTITIGTSGAVRRTSPRPVRDGQARLFSYMMHHGNRQQPTLYAVGGPTNNGANVLQWVSEKIMHLPVDGVLKQAATVPAGADGLLFLPYLHGERAPLWDASVRGSFQGLDYVHTSAHMARAALEGVLFNLRRIELLLARHAGPTHVIHANGGFAQSPFWVQLMADIFAVPVRLNASNESSGIGAALLAHFALANPPTSLAELAQTVQFGQMFTPNPDAVKIYRQHYNQFAALIEGSSSGQ
ncbi:gluconokinase [Fibrella aquatilis]|uniref:Gluconokinase n=1 Tax=Fibrella aquatilis TaxID=2817059 RepID=A0A939G5B6_9BACT|nr:gluconokinase [Fibrella aquatilis]MBO0930705.1 gluconokinase [Fibrella aquatilis]